MRIREHLYSGGRYRKYRVRPSFMVFLNGLLQFIDDYRIEGYVDEHRLEEYGVIRFPKGSLKKWDKITIMDEA